MFELTYAGLLSDNGETARDIKHNLESKYNFIGDFIKKIRERGEYLENNEKKEEYFRGYRGTFSSYFRNIYGAIKFLNEDTHLSDEEKCDLMQILSMQLSYAELSLIGWYFLSWHAQSKSENEKKKERSKKTKELIVFIGKCGLIDDILEGYFDKDKLFDIKERLFKQEA